ncbi:MAG: putative RNA-binding protein (contains domain) [Actinomycetia bacterium]|nr:putative RNA-binding protein (contains domain) [Actinomycetes bacterium]
MSDDALEGSNEVEDDYDDYEDEVGAEGNRIVGSRARAVVEHCARALVEDPDGIDVDVREEQGHVTLLVHAAPGDMGRLIGKRGRVIQAVRQLVRAAAASEGTRATVDVAD